MKDPSCASRELHRPGAHFSLKPFSFGWPSDSLLAFILQNLAMTFLTLGPTLLLLLQFTFLITPCYAQTNKLFQWQFGNNFVSTSLPTCLNLGIVVKSYHTDNSTHGTPPYYMMAMPVGGIPTTTLIGSDENNLNWLVNFPDSTKLMLSVIDANGSAGGIPPQLFTVATGQSTQCINAPTTSTFTVTSNLTDVTTCQPWGLTMTGGIRPYTITFAALNSPVVTNVTLTADEDAFTYIDRADPNTQLLAAVSDLSGQFATGTPIVSTSGSSNVDCTGLVSSGGNSTQIQQAAEDAANAAKNHKRNSIIIGVVVALVAAIAITGAIAFFLHKRKKRLDQEGEYGPDLLPRKFEEGQIVSVTAFPSEGHSPRSPKSPLMSSSTALSSSHYADAVAFDPYRSIRDSGSSSNPQSSTSGDTNSRPSFAAFPRSSSRRYNKAAEAASMNTPYSDENRPTSSALEPSTSGNHSNRSGSLRANSSAAPDGDAEIIIQHRDGGVVRELPPPYADRSAPPASR